MLRNPTTVSLQVPRLPLLPLLLSLQASHPLFNELLLPRLVFASFVVVMISKTIWFNRISTWVSKNARTTMTVGATDRGPEHRGVHVPNPPGTESNIALYYVATARQTNWPPGLVKPHVDLKTGRYTVRPVGSLRNFLNRLFSTRYYDKQLKQYVRGSIAIPDYKGVGINMYTMPDASTGMIECDTVTLMNSRAESRNLTLAAPFWNYSHNFQKEPAKVKFHENFPGLARAYKECEFDGEVARLVETLQDVPAGYAFCTGGPGSGKTTTVHNIVKAILFAPADGDWGPSAPATDDWQALPMASLTLLKHPLTTSLISQRSLNMKSCPFQVVPTFSAESDQIAAVLQLWGDQRGIVLRLNVIVEGDQLQVIFPTDDCTTIWIHNDNAVELSGTDFNHYSGVKLAAVTSPSTELDLAQQVLQSLTHIQGMVSVPAALDVDEEAPAPLTEYEEPELGEYKKAEGFVSAKDTAGNSFDQSSNKPRVAWIAAQKKVVDDAAHCAFLQCLTPFTIDLSVQGGVKT
ncbi:hypothetical protein DER44DRAFT_747574 [Fusarium oxysporum]|nr:hypothetical protein DER44DRAFT_747574 [Fusarium oxysporum]